MPIPYVPTTHSDGQSWTAAKANLLEGAVRDAQLMPAVRVSQSAGQSINNVSTTVLVFDTENFDQVGGVASTMHSTSTNTSRLTCLYAGIYHIHGHAQFAPNATGFRSLDIYWNNSAALGAADVPSVGGADFSRINVQALWPLSVNDYVELRAYQTSGGALSLYAAFSMVRVA